MPFGHPTEDFLFVVDDLFGSLQHVVGDIARDGNHAVRIAQNHIARLDEDIADLDGDLVMRDETTAQAAVGTAVAVEDGEVLVQNLLGVPDTCLLYTSDAADE